MKRPVSHLVDTLWAGDERSLQVFLHAQDGLHERLRAAGPQDDEEDDLPYLLSIDGEIATVSISGSLTNRESPYNKFFGITSYGAIREALIHAANDASVKHIVLDINSGGGAVNGVADTANLVRLISNQVKPVTAFTDGAMCSAAYWIGCSAGEVYASNISTVGSIGVIATHMEYSAALKQDGVGVTVIRSGQYKALANSVEPLTEVAKAQIKSQLDAVYSIFIDHVSAMTDRPRDYVEASMAQGREFIGEQALNAGLVDGITTFDSLLSSIRAQVTAPHTPYGDTSRNSAQGTIMKHKQAMTSQQIAALAEGGLAAGAVGAAAAAAMPAAPAPEAAAAEAAAAAAAVAAAAAPEAAAAPQAAQPDVLTFLQTQVKEKDAAILASTVENTALKAKVADLEVSASGLREIAVKSLNNMRVALQMPSVDASALSATEILAAHAAATVSFQDQFKAGGVSAVDAAAAATEVAGDIADDPIRRARLAAASTKKPT